MIEMIDRMFRNIPEECNQEEAQRRLKHFILEMRTRFFFFAHIY